MNRTRKILLVAAALILTGLLAFGLFGPGRKDAPHETEAAVSGPVTGTGEAAIGGRFDLIDTDGRPVTDRDLLGRYALVYFGYANCPDVCPLDMNRISLALERLSERKPWEGELQPVFITVDPARDTPAALAAFLSNFHPSFIGLTGTAEEVARAARAYKVSVEEMLERDHRPSGLISHSAYIYLMGPDGKYLAHFDADVPAPELAEALAKYLP